MVLSCAAKLIEIDKANTQIRSGLLYEVNSQKPLTEIVFSKFNYTQFSSDST